MIWAVIAAQWLGTSSSVCACVYTDTSQIQTAAANYAGLVSTAVQPVVKIKTGCCSCWFLHWATP